MAGKKAVNGLGIYFLARDGEAKIIARSNTKRSIAQQYLLSCDRAKG
jgi:hypothetical protein